MDSQADPLVKCQPAQKIRIKSFRLIFRKVHIEFQKIQPLPLAERSAGFQAGSSSSAGIRISARRIPLLVRQSVGFKCPLGVPAHLPPEQHLPDCQCQRRSPCAPESGGSGPCQEQYAPAQKPPGIVPGSERRYHTGHAPRAAECRTRSQTGQPSARRGKIPRPAGRTALPERRRPPFLPDADQPRQPPVKQSASPPQPTAKRTSGQQAVRYSASGRSTTCSVA